MIYLQLTFVVISTVIKPHSRKTLPVSLPLWFCLATYSITLRMGLVYLKYQIFMLCFLKKKMNGALLSTEFREGRVMGTGPAEAGITGNGISLELP